MRRSYGIIILILILIVSAIIGISAYQHLLKTPENVVRDAFKSVEKKDKTLWEESVSQKSLIQNSYKIYRGQFEPNQSDDIFVAITKFLDRSYNSLIQSSQVDDIDSAINDYFISNQEELVLFDKQTLFKFLNAIDHSSLKVTAISQKEKITLIEMSFKDKVYKHEFLIRSILEKQENVWKIVAIINAHELITMIETLELQRRNDAILRRTQEMMRFLEITEFSSQRNPEKPSSNPLLSFLPFALSKHQITVKNVSKQTITEFSLKMSFKSSNGETISQKKVFHSFPLMSGNSYTMHFETYDKETARLVEFGLAPEVSHVFIVFESGEVLENKENNKDGLFQ